VTGPEWQHDLAELYGGDALAVLAELPDGYADAVITDPPYSSGGMMRSDRVQTTQAKYTARGGGAPDFTGDNRDQRGYGYWSALWLGEALRVTRPGGPIVMFTDWRQLPTSSDVLQAGGWVWRGVIPWVKPFARPQVGRFTAQCEFAVWGSNGPMPIEEGGLCLPGFWQGMPPREREHITQKPVALMRELVQVCPPGGRVLDPFAGAGTTGVGALLESRRFTGIEIHAYHRETARLRLEAVLQGYRERGEQGVLIEEGWADAEQA
jgi:site-specific DNA-methyltransferase (adenine-specific)